MTALLGMTLALPTGDAAAQAGEPAAPDISGWSCRFCAFEDGASGWLAPRIGWIYDNSYHFGDYTGLDDRGLLLDLDAASRLRDAETGDAWDVSIDRFGLDSRAVALSGGRQGTYRLSLGYDALPHRVDRDTRTVFTGEGNFGLPAGWTRAGSTAGMTSLDSSLRGVWLAQDRERTRLGLEFMPHRTTDLRFDYRRDEINGTGAVGASFVTLASQLPRPISQTLDRADVSASYRHALGHAQLALASSFFSNDVDALVWQNPYSGPVAGATTGQLAQAPDNRAHRLSLSLGSAPGAPLHASAQFALGRLTQDERFLPATVNPDETAALPRSSLDGRVDTSFASLRVTYPVWRGTRLRADYLHDRRDNRTPVAAYTQVVMDTFTGDVRSNAPFGSRRERWRFSAEDRNLRPLRVGVGIEDETRERRFYDTTETQEQRYWLRLGWRPVQRGDLRLRLSHAERDGTEPATDPAALPQNPLLRAFNTSDRDRDEARADLALSLPGVTATFNAVYAREDFPQTLIGRTARDEIGYGTDLALHAIPDVVVSAFASRHLQDTEQAGSQGFSTPDWFTDQEDTTSVMGLHAAWQAPKGFEVGADYTYARSEGAIVTAAGASEGTFPLLATRWNDLRGFVRYAARPDLSFRLDLVNERYEARDWALDGVGPDTVPNLLALGQGGGSAEVTAVLLGLRWEFRDAPPDD